MPTLFKVACTVGGEKNMAQLTESTSIVYNRVRDLCPVS